jgi:hypothetical protein
MVTGVVQNKQQTDIARHGGTMSGKFLWHNSVDGLKRAHIVQVDATEMVQILESKRSSRFTGSPTQHR